MQAILLQGHILRATLDDDVTRTKISGTNLRQIESLNELGPFSH
jgi:hypothetical protein